MSGPVPDPLKYRLLRRRPGDNIFSLFLVKFSPNLHIDVMENAWYYDTDNAAFAAAIGTVWEQNGAAGLSASPCRKLWVQTESGRCGGQAYELLRGTV